MIRTVVGVVFAAVVAFGMATTRGGELGSEIDLSTFGESQSKEPSSVWEDMNLEEVGLRGQVADRRFYISGMIGPSFANGTSPVEPDVASSDTLFNAGGALGIAFERSRGRLRIEVEGMGRSDFDGLEADGDFTVQVTNNWSVITNVWRDFMLTDRFGVYGGGGIGGGGYKLSETDVNDPNNTGSVPADGAFAWQAGGGLLWQVSDRLTFDVGYRYFQINPLRQTEITLPNQFSASELMFSLRLYEPFRNWRGTGR
jgi:opacity protein-like surface antigen